MNFEEIIDNPQWSPENMTEAKVAVAYLKGFIEGQKKQIKALEWRIDIEETEYEGEIAELKGNLGSNGLEKFDVTH